MLRINQTAGSSAEGRRDLRAICNQLQHDIISVEEAGRKVLFCIAPPLLAEHFHLLPDDVLSALRSILAKLPVSDEEWVNFREVGQFDGDEWTWAKMVFDCRANTEAARTHILGEVSLPPSPDFRDRIRAAYRAELDAVRWQSADGRDC
jgi:hypothetical protein